MRNHQPVERLRKTRWWLPTVERYRLHVETCKRLKCDDLIMPFYCFADEVIGTPEKWRDDLLEIADVEPYVAWQQYPAYIEPTKEEQKLDFYSASMGRKLR